MRKKVHKIGWLLAFLFLATQAQAQIKVEAESFTNAKSLSSKIITENNGKSIGYFDEEGEELTYDVTIPSDGLYQISFRYLTGKPGNLKIQDADGNYFIFDTEANNAEEWWNVPMNNWPAFDKSKSARFPMKAGKQQFKVINTGKSVNIDYFEFTKSSSTDADIVKITTIPSKLNMMPDETIDIVAIGYNAAGEIIAANTQWSANAPNGRYKAASREGSDVVTITMGETTKELKVKVAKPTKKQEFVVTKNGKLCTKNGAVCNQSGNKVSLMGPSFFWSCSAPLWWKAETVDYLVSQFNVQLIRLPVSIAPGDNTWDNPDATWNTDNFLHSRDYTKKLVDDMVRAAIENDIYVIIDFHEHYAHKWTDLAKEFFTYFATKWREYPNVMYEIYNEPITGNSDVVNYAKQVIPVIRKIDPQNVIIVGSTQYSREPHNVTAAGEGYSNIAYTWHGYVEWGHQSDWNDHNDWNNGVPVVVTEWGLNWSKNDGGLLDRYRNKQVINAFWSMSNKGGDDAKWSILKDNCFKTTGWSDSDMTENGAYLLGVAKNWVNYKPTVYNASKELKLSICSDKSFFLPTAETTLSGEATGGSENYTYKWAQVSGPTSATIANANAASTKVSGLEDGIYLFSLTVNDGEDELSETVKVTVYPEGYVDPGLIDDVNDNDNIALWGGKWFTKDDASKNANPHSQITESENLANDGAIKADFTMGEKWQGEGWMGDPYCTVNLYLKKNEEGHDISGCSKITYRFKGAAHEFRVAMTAVKDDDYHTKKVSASSDWTTVTVNWSDLKQAQDWGKDMDLDLTDIKMLSWQLKESAGKKGTLWIDDVTCVGGSAPVGIEEALSNNEISFYVAPNPAVGGQTSIYVSTLSEVTVMDITGRVVKQFTAIPYFDNQINLSQPGLYMVKVGTEIQKLIVR